MSPLKYYRFLGTVATSGVSSFFFQTRAQASKHSGHKDKQRLSPLADQLVNIQYFRDQWSDRIAA
jgi:hypothetical protein